MGSGHCLAVQHRFWGAQGPLSEAVYLGCGGTDHRTQGETRRPSSLGLPRTHTGLPTCVRQTGVDGHGGDIGMVDRDRNIWGKLSNSK